MFDSNGNLPPGFHEWTLAEAEERLVRAFPKSRTRARIWAEFNSLRTNLLAMIQECEQWLDGSFVTAKVDPGDLDMLIIVDKTDTDVMTLAEYETFAELFSKERQGKPGCHLLLLLRESEGDSGYDRYLWWRASWRGWFGFDRQEHAKGIVRVRPA